MPFSRLISASASKDRLEKMIAARLALNADKATIDAKIWNLFGERWAVMFTDLSGFSRRVARYGIIHFLQTIRESKRLLIPVIEDHGGILLKVEGDSFLVIFRSAIESLAAAVDMQHACAAYNVDRAAEDQVLLCVGLGFGDVLRIGDDDVFGAEVNATSKLGEDIAKSGEILVTEKLRTAAGRRYRFAPIKTVPPGADGAFRLEYKPKN